MPSALGAFLLAAHAWPAHSMTLDWNYVNWTNTSTFLQEFDIDPFHAGNDIRVSFSGATNRFDTTDPSPASWPDDSSALTGGVSATNQSLVLNMDYESTNEFLVVTITFLYTQGVNGVTIDLYDIDRAIFTYRDYISGVRGVFGTNVYAATASVVNPSLVTIANNGTTNLTLTAQGNEGAGNDNSDVSNATLSFGSNTLASITFRYSHIDLGLFDPAETSDGAYQRIGIGPITYVPVPEPSASAALRFVALGLAALALHGFHRTPRARAGHEPGPRPISRAAVPHNASPTASQADAAPCLPVRPRPSRPNSAFPNLLGTSSLKRPAYSPSPPLSVTTPRFDARTNASTSATSGAASPAASTAAVASERFRPERNKS